MDIQIGGPGVTLLVKDEDWASTAEAAKRESKAVVVVRNAGFIVIVGCAIGVIVY